MMREKQGPKGKNDLGPGCMVEKQTESFIVLIGKKISSIHEDVLLGFLAFLGLFYLFDAEYPKEYAVAFSIMHQHVLRDKKMCPGIFRTSIKLEKK